MWKYTIWLSIHDFSLRFPVWRFHPIIPHGEHTRPCILPA